VFPIGVILDQISEEQSQVNGCIGNLYELVVDLMMMVEWSDFWECEDSKQPWALRYCNIKKNL
jgi:hypothetical protein